MKLCVLFPLWRDGVCSIVVDKRTERMMGWMIERNDRAERMIG